MIQNMNEVLSIFINGHIYGFDFYWMFYDHFSVRSLLAKLGAIFMEKTSFSSRYGNNPLAT